MNNFSNLPIILNYFYVDQITPENDLETTAEYQHTVNEGT